MLKNPAGRGPLLARRHGGEARRRWTNSKSRESTISFASLRHKN